MSDGNSSMRRICPLGNTQEMFKPQIRSYPIKIYAETFLLAKLNKIIQKKIMQKRMYPLAKLNHEIGEFKNLSRQCCNCAIFLSFM